MQTNIVIPPEYNGKPVKEIGYAVFNGCSYVKDLTLLGIVIVCSPSHTRAFDGCSGLKKIYIPESVIEIEDVAFSFCKSLERIEVSEISFTVVSGITFFYKNFRKICTPHERRKTNCLERIEVSESNPFYSVKGNCLIDTENKTIIAIAPSYSINFKL